MNMRSHPVFERVDMLGRSINLKAILLLIFPDYNYA